MASTKSERVSDQKVLHRRVENENIIGEMYKMGRMIGQGSFGVVFEAESVKTKEKLAVKKVNKEKAGSSGVTLLEREVAILKRVKHDHIISLEEIFETSTKMFLIMELCEFGDLKTILFRDGPFSEASCQYIVKNLSEAIVYLHKNGIVHRDLKLENILIAGCEYSEHNDPLYDIRLTDFGLSVVRGGAGSESMLQTSCGTPVYMAPEVIRNHDYSEQCDQWSIGIILYALLSCKFPFIADNEEKLFEEIKQAKVDFTGSAWDKVSLSAKSLLVNLLVADPAHRYTAKEVASHPWTNGKETTNSSRPPNVLALMKNFAKLSNEDDDGEEFSEAVLVDSMTSLKLFGSTTTTLSDNKTWKTKVKSAPLIASENNVIKNNIAKRKLISNMSTTDQLPSKPNVTKQSSPITGIPRKKIDSKSVNVQPGSKPHPPLAILRDKTDHSSSSVSSEKPITVHKSGKIAKQRSRDE